MKKFKDVIKNEGEEVIASDDYYAVMYAEDVLRKPFYYNGELIAKP